MSHGHLYAKCVEKESAIINNVFRSLLQLTENSILRNQSAGTRSIIASE